MMDNRNEDSLGNDVKAHLPERPMAFRPPSDFRVNVESGLRTALATGFAFLWMGKGLFPSGLSFFAGVTTIVCYGNSAGATIDRSLEITHGALIGCICAFVSRWSMEYGPAWGGLGYFVSVFLVLRSRRLTSLGKKFGCLTVTLLGIAGSRQELPMAWLSFVGAWLRTYVEGGVFAVAACLLPYPRFATRDGALRAQFMCRALSAAVRACETDFVKGRDESSISRARLLCEQVRYNLGVLQRELKWSRLELGLLFFGSCVGGMHPVDALRELGQVMEEVLQGVRGMRQSMSGFRPSRAQTSFAKALGPSLRGVAIAVDEVLEALPRGTWLPRAGLVSDGSSSWLTQMGILFSRPRVVEETETNREYASSDSNAIDSNRSASTSKPSYSSNNNSENWRARSEPRTRREAVADLERAVAVMLFEYNVARKAILYGLDEHGRPLVESGRLSSATAEAAVATANDRFGEGGDDGGGGDAGVETRVAQNDSQRPPVKGVSFGLLAPSGKRELSSLPLPYPPLSRKPSTRVFLRPDGRFKYGDVGSRSSLLGADTDDEIGDGTDDGVPHHVLVMKEREKLGSTATMARGAFLFSLAELCGTLTRDSENLTWPREKDPFGAVRLVLGGVWTAVRPPPGLFTAIGSTGCSTCRNFLRIFRCCSNHRRWTREENRRESQRKSFRNLLAREGGGGGERGCGQGRGCTRRREENERSPACGRGRLRELAKHELFWCFKVSLSLTVCAAFTLWPYLSEAFKPAVWIPLTTSFIMTDKRASAASTCLLRLVGTVLGAVYGILTANLSSAPADASYDWQAHAILLPWVAFACFFRNSTTFAYAALVAAFTAVVMFTGSSTALEADGQAVSLARIINTVVAISIYLTIDTLLVPTRAKGLVRAEIYSALDAALNEVRINGERLFGAKVCPRNSRSLSRTALRLYDCARSSARGEATFAPPEVSPPPLLPNPPQTPQAQPYPEPPQHCERKGLRDDERAQPETNTHICEGIGDSLPCVNAKPQHQSRGDKLSRVSSVYSDEEAGESWGRALLEDDEAGGEEGKWNGTTNLSGGSTTSCGDAARSATGSYADVLAPREERLDDGVGLASGAPTAIVGDGLPANEESGEVEEVKGRRVGGRLGSSGAAASSRLGRRHSGYVTEYLQKLVSALALQKHYLPLAELEPQLWFQPFPASAYHGMVAAQEELLRALSLMSRAAIAVADDRSQHWRVELGELGTHLAALVQLLKAGLEDARDVFRGDGENHRGRRDGEVRKAQEVHLLELHAEAIRLDCQVNADFVRFIQAFLERGAFPDLELESILRINTAIFAVMGLQSTLLTLGHAIATVLDRESFSYYYR